MYIHDRHDDDSPHTTPPSRKRMINKIHSLQRLSRPLPMEKDEFVLCLKLSKAEGVDPPSGGTYPSGPKRFYCAVFSGALEPRRLEICSQIVEGLPDPCWNTKWNLRLEEYPCAALRVEVLGFSSYDPDGPGTSNGVALVGRAEVCLPRKLCKQKFHKLQLLRPDGDRFKAEGTIGLSLELMPLNVADRRVRNMYMRNLGY